MTRQPLKPEILVPRLGEYLIQHGHISKKNLEHALAYQKKKQRNHQQCLLGEALIELGIVDRQVIDHAITELFLQLRNALENANRSLEKRVQERTVELQEALRKLTELNQLKANFIANVSHELRTPLTHLEGYVGLLISKSLGSLTDEQKNALNICQRAVKRLEKLIDNLIVFSTVSRGAMTLRLVPVNLVETVDKVIENLRGYAEERKIQLHIEKKPDLPLVRADEEKISWVLQQLLDNAIKFTPIMGRVNLTIQLESDELVLISISDTGVGIPPERVEEVFEPFHQLDGSSTRRYGGTGLGLALAREIINAHGSKIEVESNVKKGSTFRFHLLTEQARR